MPTRSNLRDGFAMVDEVFALSPISARAAQPNEADYEAIRDAFMETSRGRWFLGEYAKRNRNADTSMVLDAVARIEHALASQRQQQQELEQADSQALPEALAAIRAAVEDAALAAASAVDKMALEQNLAPVRKGTRIIKEISWRWREIGADSRICDLIDSQVTSIESACEQLASADPKIALLAAFDIIKTRLKELDERQAAAAPEADAVAPVAETAAPIETVATAPVAEPPAAAEPEALRTPEPDRAEATQAVPAVTTPLVAAVAAIEAIEASSAEAAVLVASVTVEASTEDASAAAAAVAAVSVAPPAMLAEPSIAEALVEIEQQATTELDDAAAAQAQDEAILELVAAEMGAPDPIEDEEFSRARTLGFDIEEPTSVDDDIVASFREPEPAAPEPAQPEPAEPELALTTAEAPAAETIAAPIAPPVEAPPMAPAPTPSAPPPAAPLSEAITVETLAAIAAAVAAPPPAPPVRVEAAPSQQLHAIAAAAPAPTASAMPRPTYEPSLGSTLLSNGLLQRPQAPANDPLSPIRRMTQPEKIAFFS
ncbi:conserved protein of unknown function [Bradyrhizobium sp. ORS 285]|nr:conserved hypothetical protein [Bradyrhizobium sp. ORS 285]SMX57286.1 conserved protein of unknown function [Bradyrhizobium sp. ORS 285]